MSWRTPILIAAFVFVLSDCSNTVAEDATTEGREFFEKQIRPLLVEHCFGCHGDKKQEGGLKLSSRKAMFKGGDTGVAVVPGKPDESLLIRAVGYLDEPKMPPKQKLAAADIARLKRWVAMGAPWPVSSSPPGTVGDAAGQHGFRVTPKQRRWWAFQPVKDAVLPAVKNGKWPRNEIDHFILAKLEARGMSPAPPADRRVWLRRATFDLTGLPPTPEELDAFIVDNSDQAYKRVIERLMESPAYGQRWARHWLDVVRYADYHDGDAKARDANCEPLQAWRYRDWVVDAFNRDFPFDQFITHQIAGDLLPIAEGSEFYADGLIATTFLSNGTWDRGDADKEKMVSDMVDDNIDTIGKAFMGLTLGCARCHDHKFDPISQSDYYGLAGVFYSTRILSSLGSKGGNYTLNRVPLLTSAALTKRSQQERQLAMVTAKLAEFDSRQRYHDLIAGGKTLAPTEFKSTAGAIGTIAADASVLVSGKCAKDSYTVKAVAPEGIEIRIVRLEALSEPSLPANGPGRANDGNFVITRLTAAFTPPGSNGAPVPIKLAAAKADFEQTGFAIASVLDDKLENGWSVHPAEGRDHVAAFEIAPDVKIPAGALLIFTIDHQYSDTHALGRFRFSVADVFASASPQESPERREQVAVRDRLQKELAKPLPMAEAAAEGGTPGGLFPGIQDVPIHVRGSYTRLGPVVPRRMPTFFAGENQPRIASGSGRREVAAWVASKQNSLTARVIVNRVWQWHFGAGLVRTPNNFGLLSQPPSHPALLDRLAAWFIDDGWSLKRLHRRIMLSAAYRQSSTVPREQIEKDPDNRWLGRFTARRLEAEAIRDAMLSVTGKLDPVAGGPASDDLAIPRRSLYVQTARWDRSSFAMLFDAANPDASNEKRNVTTVAPQALFLLNHKFALDQARHLAGRLIRELPSNTPNVEASRIQLAYRLLFSRTASDEEIVISRRVLAQSPEQSAESVWADLAQVLLCCNEFIYLD